MDELFETLTLIQTGKILLDFLSSMLLAGAISREDMDLLVSGLLGVLFESVLQMDTAPELCKPVPRGKH